MGDVDGLFAVYPDKSEGLEQRCDFADRPDIDQRRARTHADFGFPTACSQEVHIIRVEHAVLTAGDMNEDAMRCHISVVARLGRYAHGLVVHRMGWCFGERAPASTRWNGLSKPCRLLLEDRGPRHSETTKASEK